MKIKWLLFGLLSIVGGTIALLVVVAALNPLAFGFFAAMIIGSAEIKLKEAPFKPHDAIVEKYETLCAPTPFLVSSAQPKCTVNGKDGAMLKMVTLSYDTGLGHRQVGTTHLDNTWGNPSVGSQVTIRVSELDSSKFKLKRRSWVNPGFCSNGGGNGVCY